MSSCFMLSCFMLSPDCANAARDTARKHMAINLQIVFLMKFFLGFSLNLRPTHFGRANEMRFAHQSYRPFPTAEPRKPYTRTCQALRVLAEEATRGTVLVGQVR